MVLIGLGDYYIAVCVAVCLFVPISQLGLSLKFSCRCVCVCLIGQICERMCMGREGERVSVYVCVVVSACAHARVISTYDDWPHINMTCLQAKYAMIDTADVILIHGMH